MLYFNESVRGLSVGAPVTLFGLPAGEVTDVGLTSTRHDWILRGRVEITSYPERLDRAPVRRATAAGEALAGERRSPRRALRRAVEERGLRAQLRSGNLLTGQLYRRLRLFPGCAQAEGRLDARTRLELPVVPSTVTDLEAKLTGILAKLDKPCPSRRSATTSRKTLADARPELQDASRLLSDVDTDVMPELKTTVESANRALGNVDADAQERAEHTLEELRRAIATADSVLKNTDATLLGKDAPGQQELRDALQEITRAARSVRVLTDYLERHPESLIRGKTGTEEMMRPPRRPRHPVRSRRPRDRLRVHAGVALLYLERHARPRGDASNVSVSWARCRYRPRSTARRSS